MTAYCINNYLKGIKKDMKKVFKISLVEETLAKISFR